MAIKNRKEQTDFCYERVLGWYYNGWPILRHSATGDLAHDDCGHLVALPRAEEARLRAEMEAVR